jgi:hypothetical protein
MACTHRSLPTQEARKLEKPAKMKDVEHILSCLVERLSVGRLSLSVFIVASRLIFQRIGKFL